VNSHRKPFSLVYLVPAIDCYMFDAMKEKVEVRGISISTFNNNNNNNNNKAFNPK
jgi:hypothetical protein